MHPTTRRPTTTVERRRARLIERDGATCRYCTTPLANPFTLEGVIAGTSIGDDGETFTVYRAAAGYRWPQIDHDMPRARGGSNAMENLVLACGPCNVAKGTRTAEEFLAASA